MSNNNEEGEQESIESLALRCNAEVFLDAAIQISTRCEFRESEGGLDDYLANARCLYLATEKAFYKVEQVVGREALKKFLGTYKKLLIVIFGDNVNINNTFCWETSPFDYESRILAALLLYEMVKDVQETARRGETTQHD